MRVLIIYILVFLPALCFSKDKVDMQPEVDARSASEWDKESIIGLENELQADPRNSDIILQYSIAFQHLGQLERAIEVVKSGLARIQSFNVTKQNNSITQVFYSEIPLYIKLGELYLQLDDLSSAVKIYEEGVIRNSGSGELLNQYLSLLHSIGENDKATSIRERQCGKYFVSDGACKK